MEVVPVAHYTLEKNIKAGLFSYSDIIIMFYLFFPLHYVKEEFQIPNQTVNTDQN